MSPPIRDGSGSSIGSIRLGDGSEISEVRTGAGDVLFSEVPDSVVNQFLASNFAQPWPDEVGSADMSVNGMVASTMDGADSVVGDGTDDNGLASVENLGALETHGVAYTFLADGLSSSIHMGLLESVGTNNHWDIRTGLDGTVGNIQMFLRDDAGNELSVHTDSTFDDNTAHAVIINKTSNSNIDIYVDSAVSPVPSTKSRNQGFNNQNFEATIDHAFFARNNNGSVDNHSAIEFGEIQYNTEPYTEDERSAFISQQSFT